MSHVLDQLRAGQGHGGNREPGKDGSVMSVSAARKLELFAEFKALVVARGGTVLEAAWFGNNKPYHVRCAAGHRLLPTAERCPAGRRFLPAVLPD